MRKIILILIVLSFSFSHTPVIGQSKSTSILATTGIVTDFVQNVAGDKFEIQSIIPSGLDPHDYQATVEDTNEINNADLVFFSGAGLEESMDSVLTELQLKGKAISLFDSIPESKQISVDKVKDPHFWMDPQLVIHTIEVITTSMIDIDPQNENYYRMQADVYIIELNDLHNTTIQLVNQLPEEKKFLVTEHEAYNYWKRAYGFEGESLEGISTLEKAGIDEIETLATYLKENKIEVIFLESTSTDDYAQAVIEASAAIDWEVVIGGTLVTGSLEDQQSYLEMMMKNANTVVDAILSPPTEEASFHFITGVFIPVIYIHRRKIHGRKSY